ncbi:MAG: hypothetical protein JXR39_09815 [Marinilabiliaceae bacterium]|nr:hypothetical protein [Marinilabiliaceae bacterium]
MKTIKMFGLLLMATLVFASCSKDDDDDDAADVAGTKWETTYFKNYRKVGTNDELIFEYTTKEQLQAEYEYKIFEFKSNKDFFIDGEKVGTWSKSGNTITATIVKNGEKITKVMTIEGNTITIYLEDNYKDSLYNETIIYTKMN